MDNNSSEKVNNSKVIINNNVVSKKRTVSFRESSNLFFNVIFILFLSLLIINIVRSIFSNGGSSISFYSLLKWFSQNGSIGFANHLRDFTIKGDWLVLNPLKNFLNIFTSIFSILFFLGQNLYNLIFFILKLFAFICGF